MKFQMVLRGVGAVRLLVAGFAVVALPVMGTMQLAHSADWREVNDDVRDRIAMLQPPIGPHNIEIEYRGDGHVRLEGYVDTETSRERVEQAAEGAEGVYRVENELAIAAKGTAPRNEEVAKIEEAFRRDAPHGRYNVAVHTDRKDVTLKGVVDSEDTRQRLVTSAGSVAKRPIIDQLVIEGARPDAEVQQAIRRVLEKEYPHLAKEVTVSVKNGVASLEGNVASRRDVDKLLASVLMVDGVTDIISDVTVHGRPYTQRDGEKGTK